MVRPFGEPIIEKAGALFNWHVAQEFKMGCVDQLYGGVDWDLKLQAAHPLYGVVARLLIVNGCYAAERQA